MSDSVDHLAGRPRPTPTELTAGFWEAAHAHQLVVQRCDGCGGWRHYPQPLCPECHSDRWTWAPVSGRGVIHTYTVTHQAFHPAWVDRVPFVVATVELEEGMRMVSDLPPGDTDRVAIGLPVECWFEDHQLEDGTAFSYPRFRLTGRS